MPSKHESFPPLPSHTFALAPSSPALAPSSPVPRPFLARSSTGPRPVLARPRPKQSSRQNGQKRNLLVGARGGFLILRHKSGPEFYRKLARSLSRILSRNHPDNFQPFFWRRTNVQQQTCNIDSSSSFYYLFFSFVLIELKPFVLKGQVLGEIF